MLPTFDPRLVGTGLLDKLLFQGASAGFRLELPLRSAVYASFGRSSRTGDARRSLNQMYGVAKNDIFRTGLRADVRYSKFDSSFGRGTYRSLSVSRGSATMFCVSRSRRATRTYVSALTNQNRSRFVSANADWSFLARTISSAAATPSTGRRLQNYDQMYVNLGYRF